MKTVIAWVVLKNLEMFHNWEISVGQINAYHLFLHNLASHFQ